MENKRPISLSEYDLGLEQIKSVVGKTPKNMIYTRPGKGGKSFNYVPIGYFIKKLNYVFGFAGWDFEVVDQGIIENQVWVKGRLTLKDNNGRTITKEQFGAADIKRTKGDGSMVSLGNDMKAAASDCLKKCAALIGIASDVYYENEYRETDWDKVEVKTENDRPATANQTETILNLIEKKKISKEVQNQKVKELGLSNGVELTFKQAGELIKKFMEL